MPMHICYTSDNHQVGCFCRRGQDHNEEEFGIRVGEPLPVYSD